MSDHLLVLIFAGKLLALFLVIYAYLSFSGFGLYYLITPRRLFRRGAFFVISPLLGLAQISIVGSWVFGLDEPGRLIFEVQIAAALVLFLLVLVKRTDAIKADFRAGLEALVARRGLFVLGVLVYLFLISPLLSAGFLTPVFRVGVDVSQYPLQADFLLHNGTLDEASRGDVKADPYAQDMAFNTVIMRWGTAYVLSSLACVTGCKPYEIAFVALIVMIFLTGGAMAYWLRLRGLPGKWVLWGSLALIFNPNELNVFFEHLEGQAYATPLTILLFAAVLEFLNPSQPWEKGDLRRGIVFVSLIAAGILIQHNEVFLFSGLFLAVVFLVQWLVSGKNFAPKFFHLLGILGLGFLWAGPDFLTVIRHYVALLGYPNNAGWEQPKWATLSDILGFSNIYANFSLWLDGYYIRTQPREGVDLVLSTVLSVFLLALCILGSFKRPMSERALFLAALFGVLGGFIALDYLGLPTPSYLYFKIYTLLLPVLMVCLVMSVFSLERGLFGIRREIVAVVLAVGALLCGCDYVVEYQSTRAYLTRAECQIDQLKGDARYTQRVYLSCPNGGEVWSDRGLDRIREYALRTVMPGRIMDQLTDTGIVLEPYADFPVILMVDKKSKYAVLFGQRSWPVLFQNEKLVFYETGRRGRDIVTPSGLKLNALYGPGVRPVGP